MILHYFKKDPSFKRNRNILLFVVGFILCFTILIITIFEKFSHGGWVTLLITGTLIFICMAIKKHYDDVTNILHRLYANLKEPLPLLVPSCTLDKNKRTAAILVGSYGGLGVCTVKNILKNFPGVFQNFVFISAGIIDSGKFKGKHAVEKLKKDTEARLLKYVRLGASLGIDSSYRMKIGTDVVAEASEICQTVSEEFPLITFFTGKIIFEEEKWFQKILHNETGMALQKKLQKFGLTMVILPAKVSENISPQPPHLFN